ncbi:uncharacterized protein EKO05_0009682 [Ascochyta rabiei]|uniref:EthD domain-containing protein n=1 Tax=Didymella rabiei TaxID=5454 RepID=A0A163CJR8_DIDRA|nr:uncharacterized protein EKO05_0009682 [Ascochyta rabiei]KZM22513.1 hypothetical protein ST47_g6203 [Ascochyta rabiei]UPX19419.1 hypothetical protein EKO05_0009682 [Ascochyta rabiei]
MLDASKVAPCPNHYTHAYHFNELSLETSSNEQPYFRALVFFNKKPDVTAAFFHEHWKSVHADLTLQTPGAGVNLMRYVQFHQEAKHVNDLQPLLDDSGGSIQIMPYDGCAEFHAKSAKEFVVFMKSVWASDHLVGCGKRFADMTQGYYVMVGYDNLIYGNAIPEIGGADGILAEDARFGEETKT